MLTISEQGELNRALRKCQRDAIERATCYIQRDFRGKSMLVCLPTGAGKTGVIATICQGKSAGATLVLSPRRSVCDQLKVQVGGSFFSERGVSVANLNPVVSIGSEVKAGTVVIDTFQKLVAMDEAARTLYLKKFDLVVVDEGHSEPAPIWGRIVRSMSCRKVILTATPYRNDLFQFDIGEVNYGFTFENAVKEGVVLDPEFSEVDLADMVELVSQWLKANERLKCIVKCEDYESVREHLRKFAEEGIAALGFHEQFSGSGEARGMSGVPSN